MLFSWKDKTVGKTGHTHRPSASTPHPRTMSDDDAEVGSDVEDRDEEGPPAPGDMQRGLFRDFLGWKGLVLIEPTALTHNPGELSEYEKQRKARIEANQDMLRQLGLA